MQYAHIDISALMFYNEYIQYFIYLRGAQGEVDMEPDTLLLDRRTQSLVENYVPEGEILEGIVNFFSVFADSTRVRILSALAITEMCVTDISRVLDINQTTVSHQLRFLKNIGIVSAADSVKSSFTA